MCSRIGTITEENKQGFYKPSTMKTEKHACCRKNKNQKRREKRCVCAGEKNPSAV